ncbi:MAG: UDP-N-acetylmuramoyl-L-alanine--D-glutamate ligase [Spirochaetia bacterium]|jgi:UDP-N-acetylmuramoylalanine--D-glutamate ligase|nr:UDP-N-acetylmuramoyl-L-alanine--D-glutamate ligase [Spirochaetia bacterium]
MMAADMNVNELKKILVVGLGFRTGLAASNFLARRGVETVVTDSKSSAELADIIARLDKNVRVITGKQEPAILDEGFDCIVLSPGVPKKIPLIAAAVERNIPVLAEIELAWRFLKGSVIAITGTDGKTTTTMLTHYILKELGFHALVGGNVGIPLISIVDESSDDTITVVELSSFQLETIDSFRPDAAAILNITPDHLDRYDSMEDYFAAKMRITMNQTEDDFLIYSLDDIALSGAVKTSRAKTLAFSIDTRNGDIFYKEDIIFFRDSGERRLFMKTKNMFLVGLHNIQNSMASILLVRSILEKRGLELDYDRAVLACSSFKGMPHRMELLGVFQERTFLNDSKATTVGAVAMALRSLIVPGVIILGGRSKGDDYSRLSPYLRGAVRAIILIGESKKEFAQIFKEYNCVEADTIDDAVVKAMGLSREGDAILLSPACASFDMFKDYEERGDTFREAFRKLGSGELKWN